MSGAIGTNGHAIRSSARPIYTAIAAASYNTFHLFLLPITAYATDSSRSSVIGDS